MIGTMRERMDAKCNNSNNNGFRLRKLFLAHDTHNTGLVHVEDLRQVCACVCGCCVKTAK